ncbi:hypothetical protein M9H77_16621 [Catharanthus roseus]|uniref:Uncharacterized protein n=1 Tax=Catharanthus roseus TaxID=4058 RepID=A0ACC0B2A6_CATRO|nr:hypothetical protein M9H77_16621 [Catharanthus roseus]
MRSAYRLIFQAKNNPTRSKSSSTSSTSLFWTHLWGLDTAPKVKVFLWRLYNNILPTRKNLSQRITSISQCCAMCPKNEEDILHTFLQCRIARETWLNSDFSHLVNLFLRTAPYQVILEKMISWAAHDSSQFAYLLCCIWSTFLSRYAGRPECSNRRNFMQRQRKLGASSGNQYLQKPTRINMRQLVVLEEDGCHWRPLDTDRFKLNVDTAWIADGTNVGGLIGDHLGRVQISFIVALAHSHSLEHTKTVAIHLAEKFGYNNYNLESDCKVVIDKLLT